VTATEVASALRAEGVLVADEALLRLVGELEAELLGAGPLEPLLHTPEVTDVLVNGPDQVWVDRGGGLERVDIRFPSDAAVRRLAQRLAGLAGRRLDDASPFVDARLPDGIRLHAALSPVAIDGTSISLRVPFRRPFTTEDLITRGAIDQSGAEVLRMIVDRRASFLVTGGTGSGKTTVLGALLGCVDADQRIVVAEESAELRISHPHVVRLEARPANAEGAGLIQLRDLVRQALRMRPDRIVIGEVRGAEVLDLLSALNTGHEGGCGTVHANSPQDVPSRLEALGMTGGLSRDAVRALIASGLDVVIHMRRGRDGVRRIESIGVTDAAAVRTAIRVEGGRARPGEAVDLLGARLGELPW
jgi:pilus assembly protein CpaF